MRVLVGYASQHGSTAAIAERIGQVLERAGFVVNVLPVLQVGSPRRYGAVVLGNAVHDHAWLPETSAFVDHHASVLRARPVWLFSVGLTSALPGWLRRTLQATSPGPDRTLRKAVRPRGHLSLSGVVRPGQHPARAGALLQVLGVRFGDYRDWDAIDRWATGIAADLHQPGHAFPADR